MSGVGITYLWISREFPSFVRLEGKRGDYEVYTPERTCHTVEDIGLLHCSECGGGAEKRLWAYWHYCPNCGAKVVDR